MRRLAAGEGANPDRDDLLRYAANEALDHGHDPRDVRQWAEADLLRYAHYRLAKR